MSSTGPPGLLRPTMVIGCSGLAGGTNWLPAPVYGFAVVATNGPASAVTPGTCAVAASCDEDTFDPSKCAVSSAPCCGPNAWSNGAFDATSSPAARIEAATATRHVQMLPGGSH